MKRGTRAGLLSLLALAPAAGAAGLRETPEIPSWLAGCWVLEEGDRRTDEQWMAPRGGTMIGMSRTVIGAETVEHEYLRIEPDGDRLMYVAVPSGQTETAFEAVRVDDSAAEFENPTHDFPQRILYRLTTTDSLVVTIAGDTERGARQIDFPFERAACP